MPETILRISAFYHDSAAVILVDGEIVAAALEEDIEEYFELNCTSPYMLLVVQFQEKRRRTLPDNYEHLGL